MTRRRQFVQVSSPDAGRYDLVLVSEAIDAATLGTRLNATVTPVISWDPDSWANLNVSATNGVAWDRTDLNVVAAPVTAGITPGLQTIQTEPTSMGWGTPTTSAIIGATLPDDPTLATLFAYPTGATLTDGSTAPGPRVAAPLGETSALHLTEIGTQLVNQTIDWATDGLDPGLRLTSRDRIREFSDLI